MEQIDSVYTEVNSKVSFWLRRLRSKFFVFARALFLNKAARSRTKNLRGCFPSKRANPRSFASVRSAKFPTFEFTSVYLREKQKYTLLWNSIPEYREASAADLLAPAFLSYYSNQIQPGQRIIDFGCGAGRSAIPFLSKGLEVDLVDFAEPCLDPEIFLLTASKKVLFWEACLWSLPEELPSADWVVCFDVLEHLPEKKIRATLQGMAKKMRRGGLFSIDLRRDRFGLEIGTDLHLTLKPKEWWHKQVSASFRILEELAGGDGCLVYALAVKKAD